MQSKSCGMLDLSTCSNKEGRLHLRWALGDVRGYYEQAPNAATQI